MTQVVIRAVIMVAALVAIVTWGWMAWRVQRWRWVALLPISYAAHALSFYGVVLWGSVPSVTLNLWSSGIRLQGLILVILFAVYVHQGDEWATLL